LALFDFLRKKEKIEVDKKMAEEGKDMTAEEADKYMDDVMGFTPRMFKVINTVNPEAGKTFADFYNSLWKDGALSKKTKELIFTSIGVAVMSPRCLIHVIPAIKAGAETGEIFEAVSVGVIAAGFVPEGKGIPYAFEYAVKVLEIADKYSKGEDWEYLVPAKFDHGVY
jgi:alkylhydroperoxidase/carboxymuconolactone decarboxylase family protein YurZ